MKRSIKMLTDIANEQEKYIVIIPAAGIGQRFSRLRANDLVCFPKQYAMLGEKTVLEHVLACFEACTWIDEIVIALHANDTYFDKLRMNRTKNITVVTGGDTRAQSVFNALHSIQHKVKANDWILVHDAARPCLSLRDLQNLKSKLSLHGVGGLLAERITATVKQSQQNNQIYRTLNRDKLWQALTPQMFRNEVLYSSLQYCLDKKFAVTDESQAVECLGFVPQLIEAYDFNIKITTQNDLHLAQAFLMSQCRNTHRVQQEMTEV